jgi:hypothetical protein
MSRTIRRTRGKRRNKSGRSSFENDYTFDRIHYGHWGYYAPSKNVKLEGKEFDKAYWKFHGDSNKAQWSYFKSWRVSAEKKCRAKNKEEIVRYYQNVNYEVMLHKPECLSWYW